MRPCAGGGGVGGVQGAGAGVVGQGTGNDARWGKWAEGYWRVGRVAGWGAACIDAALGTRTEARSAQACRGAAGGGASAPGTCWVAAMTCPPGP